MIKQLITVMLTSLISFSSVSIVNNQSAKADHLDQDITVYSVTQNRHGRIIRTSVGKFYLGKSEDAIYEGSGRKIYGYWEEKCGFVGDPCNDYIYLGNRTYYLSYDKFTDEPYMVRRH